MGCGDVRLLKTIGSVEFTGQERAALNKLTMPLVKEALHEVLEAEMTETVGAGFVTPLDQRQLLTTLRRVPEV